jgi:SRSO17 transposase
MLPHLVNNNRFLILPWVKISNLASHILSLSIKQLCIDWERQYGDEVYCIETFVDRKNYIGTCYQADNWHYLGKTQGFGKQGKQYIYHGEAKDIYVKVINREFADRFRPNLDRLDPDEREELIAMATAIPLYDSNVTKRMGLPELTTGDPLALVYLLVDYVEPFLRYLGRKEHKQHFFALLKGRLSDEPYKCNQPLALAYSGTKSVRNVANFMSIDKWDHRGMLNEYKRQVGELLYEPDGMITGDGCDFPKKGKTSVGVKRQYCGRLGKVDSCQASVMTGYVGANGYGLLDYALYMPDTWFDEDHELLRAKNMVPEDLAFKTKNELLLELILDATRSSRFKGKYVGVDSSFGSDKSFLDALPKSLIYFADVHCDHEVFMLRPRYITPPYSGSGEIPKPQYDVLPVTVEAIAKDDNIPWTKFIIGMGSKGPIYAQDKLMSVVEVRNGKPGKDIWLYIRKREDNKLKYAICNAPMDSTPEEVRKPALLRWSIEQCFEECKGELGMDEYEVRSWPGWYRHILLTLISHLFVNTLRKKFSVLHRDPLPVPYITQPVPLDDYFEAADKLSRGEPIDNPNIKAFPSTPHQIMTVGLVRKLLAAALPKWGKVEENIRYYLESNAAAFASHSRSTLDRLRLSHSVDPETED